MKVKIAYTVDYEQVPEMMENLLSSIKDELSFSLQKLFPLRLHYLTNLQPTNLTAQLVC